MRHANNYIEKKMLEVAQILQMKQEDIHKIITTNTNKSTNTTISPLKNNPINCYKEPNSGYYGTISINHFR